MNEYTYYVVFSYNQNNCIYNASFELKRLKKIENYQDVKEITEDISRRFYIEGVIISNWKELGKTEDIIDQEELEKLRQIRHNIENKISILDKFVTENVNAGGYFKSVLDTALRELELLKSLLP